MQHRGSYKVWLFLGLVSIGLLVGGQWIAGRHGLLSGFLLALSMNTAIFFYGDLRLLRRFRGDLLEGRDAWGLIRRLETLSRKAGIATPRLFLLHLETPTALAIGLSQRQCAILISRGLVDEFDGDEIEAVLALQVASLKREVAATGTVAAALTGILYSLARVLDNMFFFQFLRKKRPCQLRPMMGFLSPLIGLFAFIVVGRKPYLESDKLAATLIENPQRLAAVLWKLHAFQKTKPFEIASGDAPLFTVSPLTACRWYGFFQVQPNVERRIRQLVGHFPI